VVADTIANRAERLRLVTAASVVADTAAGRMERLPAVAMAVAAVAGTVVLHPVFSCRIRRKTHFVVKSALRIWDKHYLEYFVKHLGFP
jgi:hypothetical protein